MVKHTFCFFVGIIAATAGQAGVPESATPSARTTNKSLDAFGQCFVSLQERASRVWSFVPNENGGTFSNLGSARKDETYFLRVQQIGPGLRLELETQGNTNRGDELLLNSIDRCA